MYFYNVGNEFWNAYRNEGQAKVGPGDDLAGDELPDAEHPVGNAIQHTAAHVRVRRADAASGCGDQAGRDPEPRVTG